MVRKVNGRQTDRALPDVVCLVGAVAGSNTARRACPPSTVGTGQDQTIAKGGRVSTSRKPPVRKAPDDAALAWELAATARPYLSRIDADRIYITLGIGETFAAIEALITAIACNDIPLDDELMAATASWLDCYHGQSAEPRLRHLLTKVIASASPQNTPAARE